MSVMPPGSSCDKTGRLVSPGMAFYAFCAACAVADAIIVELRPVRLGLWRCPRCERLIPDGSAGSGPDTDGWWGVAVGWARAEEIGGKGPILHPIPPRFVERYGRVRVGGPEPIRPAQEDTTP